MRPRPPAAHDDQQPALPALESVRDTEHPHPTFDLPAPDPNEFELTPEAGAGFTPSLFDTQE